MNKVSHPMANALKIYMPQSENTFPISNIWIDMTPSLAEKKS